MVSYTTRADLRRFSNDMGAEKSARIRTYAASRSLAGSTFLSHSSKDDDLVAGAISLLENHGGRVYVDETDPQMPPYTSEETASLLKQRIRDTSRFVLLASENSKGSRWVPWELGIADGIKSLSRIALFPAVESRFETDWTSWEYLGLYDRIVWGKHAAYRDDIWMVLNLETNTATELRKWLTGS